VTGQNESISRSTVTVGPVYGRTTTATNEETGVVTRSTELGVTGQFGGVRGRAGVEVTDQGQVNGRASVSASTPSIGPKGPNAEVNVSGQVTFGTIGAPKEGPVAPNAFTSVAPTHSEMNEVDPATGQPAFNNAFEAKQAMQADEARAAEMARENAAQQPAQAPNVTAEQRAAAEEEGAKTSSAERDGVPAPQTPAPEAPAPEAPAPEAPAPEAPAPEALAPEAPAPEAPAPEAPAPEAPAPEAPAPEAPAPEAPATDDPASPAPAAAMASLDAEAIGTVATDAEAAAETAAATDSESTDAAAADAASADSSTSDPGSADAGSSDSGASDSGEASNGDASSGDTGSGDASGGDASGGGDSGGGDSGGGDGGGGDGGGGDGGAAPVVIDLDGDGLEFVPLGSSMAMFDMNGDALRDRTAWAGADDGLLVFDFDRNGQIIETKELVFTQWDASAATDMAALASTFDRNGDGSLSAADDLFDDFFVWKDSNQDGRSDPSELMSLGALGIVTIGLGHSADSIVFADGSALHGITDVTHADGSTTQAGDYTFAYRGASVPDLLV
jgi:hypothetical protein